MGLTTGDYVSRDFSSSFARTQMAINRKSVSHLRQVFIAIELYSSNVWGHYTWAANDTSDKVRLTFEAVRNPVPYYRVDITGR